MRARILAVSVAAALTAISAVAADPVYRSVMPDGRVLYGEAPEPGAKQTKKIPPVRSSTGTIIITPEEKQKVQTMETQRGATGVLPRPPRATEPPLESGILQSPTVLPERRY
jgi:Domain of unknown function (DUF4124)